MDTQAHQDTLFANVTIHNSKLCNWHLPITLLEVALLFNRVS